MANLKEVGKDFALGFIYRLLVVLLAIPVFLGCILLYFFLVSIGIPNNILVGIFFIIFIPMIIMLLVWKKKKKRKWYEMFIIYSALIKPVIDLYKSISNMKLKKEKIFIFGF